MRRLAFIKQGQCPRGEVCKFYKHLEGERVQESLIVTVAEGIGWEVSHAALLPTASSPIS